MNRNTEKDRNIADATDFTPVNTRGHEIKGTKKRWAEVFSFDRASRNLRRIVCYVCIIYLFMVQRFAFMHIPFAGSRLEHRRMTFDGNTYKTHAKGMVRPSR